VLVGKRDRRFESGLLQRRVYREQFEPEEFDRVAATSSGVCIASRRGEFRHRRAEFLDGAAAPQSAMMIFGKRKLRCRPSGLRMSPSFVVEQTGGFDKGWLSNSGRILAEIADD
jgi:hypothetical protein